MAECVFTCPTCRRQIRWNNNHDSEPVCPACPSHRSDENLIKFSCPRCDQHIEAPSEYGGNVVTCPTCNKEFRAGQRNAASTSNPIPVCRSLAFLSEKQGLAGLFEQLIDIKRPDHNWRTCIMFGLADNKAAARRLIDYLFDHPADVRKGVGDWEEFKIFGSYRHLIFNALRIDEVERASTDTGREGRVVHYSHSLKKSLIATNSLCMANTPITTNLLHQILKRSDVRVITTDGAEHCADNYEMLRFEDQRKLCAAELARRGNPPFDESVYLDIKNWMDAPIGTICAKCSREVLTGTQFSKLDISYRAGDLSSNPQGISQSTFDEINAKEGFRCKECGNVFCVICVLCRSHQHPRGGRSCITCGGQCERYE